MKVRVGLKKSVIVGWWINERVWDEGGGERGRKGFGKGVCLGIEGSPGLGLGFGRTDSYYGLDWDKLGSIGSWYLAQATGICVLPGLGSFPRGRDLPAVVAALRSIIVVLGFFYSPNKKRAVHEEERYLTNMSVLGVAGGPL